MKLFDLVVHAALSFTLGFRSTDRASQSFQATGRGPIVQSTKPFNSRAADRGLNLPPTQATTRDGAFFPGLYQYEYHPDQVTQATHRAGFSSLRLAVNVETAHDTQALQRHKSYIDAAGGRGVICMFDTSLKPGTSWPRTGRVTGKVNEVAEAWRSVHKVFGSYGDNVLYELFNEPWGYQGNASEYVADMKNVIRIAQLPTNRCILAGLYGSADVQSVAAAGWPGYLAYHFYSFWLPEGHRTRKGFSQKLQESIAGLSSRVFITEFGVGLDRLDADIDKDEQKQDVVRHTNQETSISDWQNEHSGGLTVQDICKENPDNKWCQRRAAEKSFVQDPNMGADVAAQLGGADNDHANNGLSAYQNETMAFLRGMRDGLHEFKKQGMGVRGLYHWHGWHNGDTWDFWDAKNARSSRMIQMMMADLALPEGSTPKDDDEFLSKDFVEDEQQVHMVGVLNLEPEKAADCPAECAAPICQPGNPAEIGGKHLTDNFCTHNCSVPYNGTRYCGAGSLYQGAGVIECGACAHPAMCFGLPCWSAKSNSVPALAQTSKRAFRIQKAQGH